MCFTVPSRPATSTISPSFIGSSKRMVKYENKSLKIFWKANAIATPPIPNPARSAVMLIPKLESKNNIPIVQITRASSLF